MSLETQFIRPATSTTGSPDSLAADVTNVVLRRIVLLSLTPPVLVLLGNVTNVVNSYVLGITSFDYTALEAGHDVIITLISLAVAWTVHRRLLSPRALIHVGLAFCVFAALWFSLAECLVVASYQSEPIRLGMSYFSFSLVWVVFFPAIVPMRSTASVVRFGPTEPERAVYLLIQACHSLHEAHCRQLIHRDIKPANLFVCEYGEDRDLVKVLDFGLVKHDKGPEETDLTITREGSITGTPAYMYPEAITGSEPVDHRADIYSLGCVAYWLLTGELVFTARTPVAMLTEHATAQPIPPSRRSELEIPGALDDVVLACLAKQPGDRPGGADELARLLQGIRFERPWDNERARSWWALHRVT